MAHLRFIHFLYMLNVCQAELACEITLDKTVLLIRYRLGKFLINLCFVIS